MELMPGTLDALILRGLSRGPKHGYAVARWIEESSKGSLTVLDGALYTSLHRMEERGWIAAEWGTSHTGRRARFYRLTPAGKKQLVAEQSDWSDYVAAVGRVMRTTTEPA
ncbi:MAG TPA: PadR family transcriptional regulator [Gemmatimonadaceae bacterium]|jgi:transcriptional regulator|nr:PadR family transcriptional regulator [Gemmatimonadaceae bacterium]